jgi:hypothetical protein
MVQKVTSNHGSGEARRDRYDAFIRADPGYLRSTFFRKRLRNSRSAQKCKLPRRQNFFLRFCTAKLISRESSCAFRTRAAQRGRVYEEARFLRRDALLQVKMGRDVSIFSKRSMQDAPMCAVAVFRDVQR